MSIWWSLRLRRDAASVPLARRLLLGAMETAGVDPDISYDLSVALTEACANAVEHGGGPGPADGDPAAEYRVTAYLDGEKCRIEVADSGPGFDRRPVPYREGPGGEAPATAESGRGLCLIEQLADHVHVRSRPGLGAVVSFDKILKWREGALLGLS
ncbi:ATP-binding protein [Streptomyces genisteinicus]|uniref:ATP-binding protein n=1 Tax=Streptomyces genisteinicus TaxID=2768068 RepID=A0A7H0HUD1_9ACTN|nr:ATP-binding protein [Streptomyces genisteinicus]QNP64147.1 ATP-binding protein [Streptomyces genisteinicus]